MFVSPKKPHVPTAPTVRFVLLPGSDRKRTRSPYGYRLIHRAADASQPGCVMSWEVWGGRLLYQVALERLVGGDLVVRGHRGDRTAWRGRRGGVPPATAPARCDAVDRGHRDPS